MPIPKRDYQRWDGDEKLKTEDCDYCEYYRNVEQEEVCGWGKAFKILETPSKKRKCEIKNRKIKHEQSIKYIDEIILNGDL